MKHFYLIAGEASGDALGAKLMRAIIESSDDKDIIFTGVGGEKMAAAGLESLFPMEELSLLGFTEIIPHIPHLLKRIKQTANHIENLLPDVVITIDAPAFNQRVAKQLKKIGSTIPRIHYVAPSVWAYKPERAAKMANLYDHLLTLLPFEPPYFEEVGLASTFVGHPIVEEPIEQGDRVAFRTKHNIPAHAPIIALMPGSRNSEIKRLLPVFSQTLDILNKTYPDMYAAVLATKRFASQLEAEMTPWGMPTIIVTDPFEKHDALAASRVALAKSGTNTLEIAMAEVPMVVTYKVNPLSAWMLRKMIKVKYVNLINILSNEQVIPELLQEECQPEKIAAEIHKLLDDEDVHHVHSKLYQKHKAYQALQLLGRGQDKTPSQKATEVILSYTT